MSDKSLTENQSNFIKEICFGKDNVILLARAGCGKTTTIEEALISYTKLYPKRKAIAICFNVNTRDNLRERNLKAYNFHGFGLFAIMQKFKSFNPKYNIDEDRGYKIALDILGIEGEPSKFESDFARSLQRFCSLAKGFNCSYTDAWDTQSTWEFIISRYEIECNGASTSQLIELGKQCLKKASYWDGTLDVDDLVWFPVVRGLLFGYCDIIFVDEAQDLNPIQIEFVRRLLKADRTTKKKIGKIAFVMDNFQAIYEWRSAMPNSYEKIAEKFNCKIMPLNETFRCAKKIVAQAQILVPDIKAFDSNKEGVVDSITNSIDEVYEQAKPGDFILSRTRIQLFSTALGFLAKEIPARVKGQDFAKELIEIIKQSEQENSSDLSNWIDTWHSSESEKLANKYKNNEELFYKKMIAVNDIQSVIKLLCNKTNTTTEIINLIKRICTPENNKTFVELMTVHGAKGLETERVFMFKNTFNVFPNETGGFNGFKEELNLLYVAITRAKNHLTYIHL